MNLHKFLARISMANLIIIYIIIITKKKKTINNNNYYFRLIVLRWKSCPSISLSIVAHVSIYRLCRIAVQLAVNVMLQRSLVLLTTTIPKHCQHILTRRRVDCALILLGWHVRRRFPVRRRRLWPVLPAVVAIVVRQRRRRLIRLLRVLFGQHWHVRAVLLRLWILGRRQWWLLLFQNHWRLVAYKSI